MAWISFAAAPGRRAGFFLHWFNKTDQRWREKPEQSRHLAAFVSGVIAQEAIMKSGTRKTETRITVLLLGVAMLPATATATGDRKIKSFQDLDANKDGYLSLKEFEATGKDNLAFKAADIDGDERLDRKEFDQYLDKMKAGDRPAPPSGNY
jgi:hypothetical protein